jgi:hypothetical protein
MHFCGISVTSSGVVIVEKCTVAICPPSDRGRQFRHPRITHRSTEPFDGTSDGCIRTTPFPYVFHQHVVSEITTWSADQVLNQSKEDRWAEITALAVPFHGERRRVDHRAITGQTAPVLVAARDTVKISRVVLIQY